MQLNKILCKPFLIYGAGSIARMIIPYLLNQSEYTCAGIALTCTTSFSFDEWEYPDVPVRSISEWSVAEIDKDVVIVIATSQQYHDDIKRTCIKYGFENIVPLTTELNDAITLQYFEHYFKKKNIDINKPILKIENLKFVNLLRDKSIPNGINMLGQLGDLVLPGLYQENNLIAEGPYEYGEVTLNPNDIVLDCGSNFGIFSVYAASKGCECYAFEPTPVLFQLIERQSELNNKKIHPVKMAVSDHEGEAVFHIDDYSCGGSSLLHRSQGTHDIAVEVTSLDQFVQRSNLKKVDFIKADIEGAERLLLQGAKKILQTYQPKISLCTYHLPDDKEVLTDLILGINPNYIITHRWKKLFAYVPKTKK